MTRLRRRRAPRASPMPSAQPPRWTRVRVVLPYFAKDVRKRRGKLAAGSAFALCYTLARLAEPWPLKVVFDQVLLHKPPHGPLLKPFTEFGTSPHQLLVGAGLFLAAAGLVRGVSYYYEDYLLSSAAQEIVYGLRSRLYHHLHRLPLSFHQNRSTGDTLLRLSSDIAMLRDLLIDSLVNLSTGVILLVLMLAVMIALDPLLTLASVAVMPLIFVLGAVYGRRIRSNSQKQRKREGEVAAAMHEALAAIDVVQLYGASEREQERFHRINRRSLKRGVKATRLEAQMNRGVELALTAGTVMVLWVGTLRALHGSITPGDLIVFVSYMRAAYKPLRKASKTVQRSAKALAAAERVVEILDTEPDLKDAPDAVPAPPLTGRVSFEDVRFEYRPGEPVLDDISFSVEPGSQVAIVGATGSGKSTLLSLVPRLYEPADGCVTVDGYDVSKLTLDSLRDQISMVQQESVLFGLSIAENIRYGRPEASDAEVEAAALAAGVEEFVDDLPQGYDTVLSERGASLSGGQRQRVAIARAFVRRSPILILDEPTTGLDAATQRGIFEALRRLMRGTTTLLVTHHMPLVRRADQVIVLDHGRIVDGGTYDELLERSPQLQRLAAGLEEPVPPGPVPPRPPRVGAQRVLFYSHNGVGVGHLQRQMDLAAAYRQRHPDSAVMLATGSHAAGAFELPEGVDYLKLPSIAMVDRYESWEPRDLPVPIEDVIEMRTELLSQAVRRFAPDLLVADFMPAGPYGELLPALAELERRGGVAIAGFRDVVDEPAFVRDLWERTGVYETLRRSYAAICVYGDPQMLDFADAYGFDAELAGRLHYCGFLGRGPQQITDTPLYERPFVLATSGGGVDGSRLLESFIGAAGRLQPHRGGTWLAVSGPLMAPAEHARLTRLAEKAGVISRRIVLELRAQAALADCVFAMAGYNTVCDVMSYRRPAVLVPRSEPSREQTMRAERLSDWHVAEVVEQADADVDHVAAGIARALAGPPPPLAPVALDGIERANEVFDSTLANVGSPRRLTLPKETF